MKKKYLVILLIIVFSFFGPIAKAGLDQAFGSKLNTVAHQAQYDTNRTVESITATGIKMVLSILGIVFMILIFYAANIWMRANGNSEEISRAKKIIVQALIGLVLVITAYSLSYFFSNLLGQSQLTK